MKRPFKWAWCSALALLLSTLALSGAPAQGQTTSEIISKGQISIGVLTGVPVYTGVDSAGKNVGLHVDVATLLARYLGVKVNIVPVTNASRIAALQSGAVDLLVAHMGATPERAKSVMFSIPYAGYNLSIVGPKNVSMHEISDLAHKRIAVPRGGDQDVRLTALNLPGLQIVRFDDDATTIQALLSGQVDGAAIGDTVANAIAREDPQANIEVKFPLFFQGFSMAVRPGSFELLQWVNNFIYYVKLSGELNKIHEKWLHAPLGNLPTF